MPPIEPRDGRRFEENHVGQERDRVLLRRAVTPADPFDDAAGEPDHGADDENAKAGNGSRQAGHEEERREREDGDEQKKRQEGAERQEGCGENLVEIQRDADEEQAGERRRGADLRGIEGLPVGERRQGFH